MISRWMRHMGSLAFWIIVPWTLVPLIPAQSPEQLEADLDALVRGLRNHPRFDRMDGMRDGKAVIEKVRSRIRRKGVSKLDVFLEFSLVTGLALDGHTYVRPPRWLLQRTRQAALPLRLRLFDDGLHVVAAEPRHESVVGARVLAIGRLSVDEALKRASAWVASDNRYASRHRAASVLEFQPFLEALDATEATGDVKLRMRTKDGAEKELTVAATAGGAGPRLLPPPRAAPSGWVGAARWSAEEPPLWLARSRAPYWFKPLPDHDAVFAQINVIRNVGSETLAAFVGRLFDHIRSHDVKKLILDLRHNSGGNGYVVQPLIHALVRSDKIGKRGTLFVLTGPRTYSAAVMAAATIERETEALFVGRPTGSGPNHPGDMRPVTLPNTGLVVHVSRLWWQHSDPRDLRTAIWPDIPVRLDFGDFAHGRDRALEAALTWKHDGAASRPPNTNWRRPSQGTAASESWR